MLENSGLWDQQHLELVEGEVINKMGKGMPHAAFLRNVFFWLAGVFGKLFVYSEMTIDVSPDDNPTSEPEPDIVVLARRQREIATDRPRPEDIRLLVEISDTTAYLDLNIKAGLYARAGIPEYWVLDISGRRLVAHRDPLEGVYRSVQAYSEQEAVSPLAAPDREFRVAEAFEE